MRRALYRKYRPKTLSEVIGQNHITDALAGSIKNGKISHAYLFIGPRGTGKTSVARILAHEVNGFKYELEDEHLDIIEIDAASNTGVDNIRNLREKAIIAPTHGKYKVYIIDEVHMLSKSAFNALLKTLEEPPEHVIFIMATTDAHKVPITITSRSQTYTFKLAGHDTMLPHLESIAKSETINIGPDALRIIAKRGGGSFRDSISLLDQISTISTGEITCTELINCLGLPSDELMTSLLTAYSAGDLTCARNNLQTLLDQGLKPETIAEELIGAIIADPKPELLGLLHKLTEVPTSSYPSVQLLLALLGNVTPSSPQATPRIVPQTTPAPTRPAIEQKPTPVRKIETPAPPKQPTEKPDQQQAQPINPNAEKATSGENLLEIIHKDNVAIHSLLKQTTVELSENTLKIYSRNKMVRNKLDKKRAYIASFLPGDAVIEILENLPSTDPVVNDLSGIFGNIEEVKLEENPLS